MRVILPVVANNATVLSESFCASAYYMLYDTETKRVDFVENAHKHIDGVGTGIAIRKNADVVITINCAEKTAFALTTAGIEIFKAINNNVVDNIELYSLKQLDKLYEAKVTCDTGCKLCEKHCCSRL